GLVAGSVEEPLAGLALGTVSRRPVANLAGRGVLLHDHRQAVRALRRDYERVPGPGITGYNLVPEPFILFGHVLTPMQLASPCSATVVAASVLRRRAQPQPPCQTRVWGRHKEATHFS